MQSMDVVVKGLDSAVHDVESIANQADNATTLFEKIYGFVLEGEQTIWKRNGPGGKKKWAPLKERTIATKESKGQNKGILRRTGALERSLTTKGGAGQIKKTGRHELEFGSSLYYAIFHQVGTPPREVLTIAAKQKKAIKEEMLDYLISKVGMGGSE